ncbi:MAG: hypothetical protein IJE73_02985 [Muribaculaceae bacterium]|nr:hypothetical protein [Muribaculaceae bacterium]
MRIINRRKIFKKAINKCLPILGILAAAAQSIKADTILMDAKIIARTLVKEDALILAPQDAIIDACICA